MSEEKFEQVFQVSGPARLIVKNIRGSVDIQPGPEGTVQITAIKHTDSGDAGSTEIELTQRSDGTVVAATHFPDGWWLWLIGSIPCRVDYVVKMPRNATLKVRGVSNRAYIDGLSGDFDIHSVSGDITLQNLGGAVLVNSVSGKISAKGLSGSLKLTSVSGRADVASSKLDSIHAKTTSGDLDVQTSLQNGPYSFNSVSGNVDLTLPTSAHYSAQLHSVSGKINSTFPMAYRSYRHGSHVVDVQGGGVMLSAQSVSGNLTLHADGNVQTASTVNRREILEKLENGEISPDEALEQMR